MKESDQSRFFRWGIPGWMMFLAFVTFTVIDIVLSPDIQHHSLIQAFASIKDMSPLTSASSATAALLVAASGIPLGFLIYQIYFYIRWNSPFARDGLFPPFIVGRWDDLVRTLEGLQESDLVRETPWRIAWTSDPLYQTDLGWKARYIENLFLEVVQQMDSKFGAVSLYGRARYLMDLVHTLGAGLFGVYMGYVSYLLLKVKTAHLSFTILTIVSAFLLFGLIWLLEVEDKARIQKKQKTSPLHKRPWISRLFRSLPLTQYLNPSANYLFFLFAILYLGSPSPYQVDYTPRHVYYRLFVIGAMALAWVFSQRHHNRPMLITELLTFAASSALAFWISQAFRSLQFQDEWWGVGWAILLFLFANLIFTKNRQNIRDDLIAMQNYTFKRYVVEKPTEGQAPTAA